MPRALVTGSYLGTISHTLTCLDVLAQRNLAIKALVVNETPGSTVPMADTIDDAAAVRARPFRSSRCRACRPAIAEHPAIRQDLRRAALAPGLNVSMKRISAATASPMSATLANSAGLWLMPPRQRTNSMADGHSRAITCASWPAPDGSRTGVWPRSATLAASASCSAGAQCAVAIS